VALRFVMRNSWFEGIDPYYSSDDIDGFSRRSFGSTTRGRVLHALADVGLAMIYEAGGSPANIIRLLTFTDLGITHTCCRFDPKITSVMMFDEDEITEIQEEEKLLLNELDGLTAELESDYVI
jgi:hypothetical protein